MNALEWRESGDLRWLEARLDGARAAFSTRTGGVSDGAYRSLNLGILTQDDRERVTRNRELLAGAIGRDSEGVAMGLQVHGAEVQIRQASDGDSSYAHPGSVLEEADAQATAAPELTPIVLVADCVPLVLAAPGAVAAVHCGWRGVAAGLVDRATETVCEIAGSGPEAVSAAIGPGIGPCCYEVGDEVRDAFRERGHADGVFAGRSLDIALAVQRELVGQGVGEDRIAASGLCTSCNPELFFSHRRDGGVTGRQAGLAWLES
jgi:purine-nucleoside/S-methyl-5'-thioadenosine phosphorylase / adenosine deaminase